MNKKNEKIEKKVEVKDSNKTDIKKTSSFKKRKNKKEYYLWYCLCIFNFQ